MIRPREYSTKDILGRLPKEQRAQFLALEPAERKLLLAGTDEEKEQYGWLPGAAAKRFAKLPQTERRAEARAGWTARRVTRKPESESPLKAQLSPPAAREAQRPVKDLSVTSARIAETARDIFELHGSSFEQVQSIATNLLVTGSDENEALDRVASMLIGDAPLPQCEAAPSRMMLAFGGRGFIRG